MTRTDIHTHSDSHIYTRINTHTHTHKTNKLIQDKTRQNKAHIDDK
jgi:hypothetical protein